MQKLLADHDAVFQEHLASPTMRNATYILFRTQNELIDVIAIHVVLHDVVDEIKAANSTVFLLIGVTSHNVEQSAVCLRFVDRKKEVSEEFLNIIHSQRITGEKNSGCAHGLLRMVFSCLTCEDKIMMELLTCLEAVPALKLEFCEKNLWPHTSMFSVVVTA